MCRWTNYSALSRRAMKYRTTTGSLWTIYKLHRVRLVSNFDLVLWISWYMKFNFELQEQAAANVFTGDEEIFAFQRAVSRLNEMQGSDYWQQWDKKSVWRPEPVANVLKYWIVSLPPRQTRQHLYIIFVVEFLKIENKSKVCYTLFLSSYAVSHQSPPKASFDSFFVLTFLHWQLNQFGCCVRTDDNNRQPVALCATKERCR